MTRRLLRHSLTLFIVFMFVALTHGLARAENESRDMVLAEAISDAVTSASQEIIREEYRQYLGSEVKKVEAQDEAFHNELDSYVRYIPTSSLASQPGKISVIKAASEYSYSFKAFGKLPIELAIGGEDININANDAVPVALPAHLTGISFGAETTLPFFNLEKTYLRLGIAPSFYSDNWDFNANSFNFGSRAFLIYQPNEKWTFVAGVAANPGFENPVFPVAGFIYKPNNKLTFNIIPERPTISYDLNDNITFFTEGGMSGGEFKVAKDGLKGAALAYNETHIGAGVKVKLSKYIDGSVSCGRLFNQYFKYRDSLGKVNMKNAMYSEFRVEARL